MAIMNVCPWFIGKIKKNFVLVIGKTGKIWKFPS